MQRLATIFVLLALLPPLLLAETTLIDEQMYFLRGGGEDPQTREWLDFPPSTFRDAEPEGDSLIIIFDAKENSGMQTLWLRQRNVQWTWTIEINGKIIGTLLEDEQGHLLAYPIPPQALRDGKNTIAIEFSQGPRSDDILVGDFRIEKKPPYQLFSRELSVTVNDSPTPCRLTITDNQGDLVQLGNLTTKSTAVRPGVVYSLTGRTVLWLPELPDDQTLSVTASRGFEYSIDTKSVGDATWLTFQIEKQVDFPGEAIDPHIHTRTYSRHGDCMLHERVITLAGEGLHAAASAEHNRHIDYGPMLDELGISNLTAIVGNEYTTRNGHFNLLGMDPEIEPPSFIGPIWKGVQRGCETSNAKVIILNHPRDLQTNYRVFDPKHHQAALGQRLDGGDYFFHGMEVISSGATQTAPFELMRDWFALLNRGLRIGAIGGSDSHDVSRYIVGQARTYVKGQSFDLNTFAKAVPEGDTHLAAGFLVDLELDENIPTITVHHPDWITHTKTTLYRNGEAVDPDNLPSINKGNNEDYWLVAVAEGPGVTAPHWPFARPYKPDGPAFTPTAIGISNVIRVDANDDGEWTSARAYAERMVDTLEEKPRRDTMLQDAADYSPAVATHIAGLLHAKGQDITPDEFQACAPHVQLGIKRFEDAQADCEENE